ncbi:hypothetical protein HYC85_006018 [Camellia sinensis]|uniref:Uncharacterized protein n=1 Tax=Camellia sinensis TaxID=4442 RepID=A0A7J7I146_CAMSI|nr:hypothetical protein HYC85_006018 [Camellia sinensis]
MGGQHVGRVVDKRRQQLIHCVTELSEAGIKFKRRKTDRFWDIKFKDGVLKIPRLLILDRKSSLLSCRISNYTEEDASDITNAIKEEGTSSLTNYTYLTSENSLFLNLIAFEQCQLDCSNDITSYMIFMDNLINSPTDVAYLHYHGIIEHGLGSGAEVADLFNRLCEEVAFDINDSYLSRLSEQVNKYYTDRWNAWRESLKHNYFNHPWAIISFVAAVVLLVLTLAQTFYAVYGYYNPR